MRHLGYRTFWVHEPDGCRARNKQTIYVGGITSWQSKKLG